MVEGTGFENRQTRKGLRGSNPLASAHIQIGPIVYRLGHKLFKLGSRVRLPVGSQIETYEINNIRNTSNIFSLSK